MWKNNRIEEESLRAYLKAFGETFYTKIVEMIDEAMVSEREKDKLVNETYFKLGLIHEPNFEATATSSHQTPRQRLFNAQSNQMIDEFKEFITELGSQANEYNNIVSQFFGRDDIMIRVNLVYLITLELFIL